jgi:hypothetical protein
VGLLQAESPAPDFRPTRAVAQYENGWVQGEPNEIRSLEERAMDIDLGRQTSGGVRPLVRVRQAARTAALAAVFWAWSACPAWADDVKVNPTGNGLTFGPKIQKMLDWGAQIALWACLASILAGAGAWGLSKHFGNYGGAHKGMQLVVGGAIGALVVASAGSIVNSMFGA